MDFGNATYLYWMHITTGLNGALYPIYICSDQLRFCYHRNVIVLLLLLRPIFINQNFWLMVCELKKKKLILQLYPIFSRNIISISGQKKHAYICFFSQFVHSSISYYPSIPQGVDFLEGRS